MKRILLLIFSIFAISFSARAQFGLPQADLSNEVPTDFVLTNITLISEPGQKLDSAYLVVKGGKILATGKGRSFPSGMPVWDGKGAWVYPSFIDVFSSYGLAAASNPGIPASTPPQYESKRSGNVLWNQALKPEQMASTFFQIQAKEAAEMRKLGFGFVGSSLRDGIMRGSAGLFRLSEESAESALVQDGIYQSLAFQKGSSQQQYPSSQMGAIALLRQTFLDADWYEKNPGREKNLGLEAIVQNRKGLWLFEVQQKYEVLRAAAIGSEFGLKLLIKGKGDEYQRLEEIKATGFPLVLTLQFPDAPDVEDPLDAHLVSIADLKHWELAPANAAMLESAGVPFVLTLSDLKDPKTFPQQLRRAIDAGLSEKGALAALTTGPASVLGLEQKIGKLKPGMEASFFLAEGNIFLSGNRIKEHVVKGKRFPVSGFANSPAPARFRLQWAGDTSYTLHLLPKQGKTEAWLKGIGPDTNRLNINLIMDGKRLSFHVRFKKPDSTFVWRFTGWETSSGYEGTVVYAPGKSQSWKARYLQTLPVPASAASPPTRPEGKVWFPFQAFGKPASTSRPPNSWLLKNATVWTNEKEGILNGADVWIENGKIKAVGKNLSAPSNVGVIDATGQHLTSGIIDEHSHIAISKGVNEGSSTTSAEVRIGDVIEADDINIYRHLGGGVTAVQQLHGSANAIGGQSSLIKMRWGKSPSEMKIQQAPGFIKFALGENVKQSNWGEAYTTRYPQTRMGVPELMYDAFTKARAYQQERNAAMKARKPFHRDLKLETLAEILEQKRFITCHSYVQSEINMLMHVADSMKFKVNTFTHILEGYKVADKMKRHGAGASTFSDWWAYKMEVKDAIPYNAALMQEAGLVVAINSDDAEMATRLNQEAAKTMKYGGVKEEDAWKMVTLNPARLLHLDQQMGSLKPGKDADVVIWSDHPLRITARAEKTFVDGEMLFDRSEMAKLEIQMKEEKERLIQKVLKAKQSGMPVVPVNPKSPHLWHCDDLGEE